MNELLQPEDSVTAKALDHLKNVVVAGESIEAWAIQRRLFALTHRRILLAATSGRFIVLNRGLFGGFRMVDLRWQDIKDVGISVGVFGATLSFSSYRASDLAIANNPAKALTFTGLRKEQAQQVYRICQFQEQAWREKRRIRELEEMHAQSGGVHITGSSAPPFASASLAQGADAAARLQQAKQMLESKLITDAEYEAIKARIVSAI